MTRTWEERGKWLDANPARNDCVDQEFRDGAARSVALAIDAAIANEEAWNARRDAASGRLARCPIAALLEDWELAANGKGTPMTYMLRHAMEQQAAYWRRIANDGESAAPQIGTPFVSAKALRICARDLLGES